MTMAQNKKKHHLLIMVIVITGFHNIVLGQSKKKSQKTWNTANHFYNKPDTGLYNNLIRLTYDSVKVYYFNRSKDETEDFSLSVDTPNIYNKIFFENPQIKLKGSETNDKGKLLEHKDSRSLIQILLYSNKDYYGMDDPVGTYAPTVGFAFFKRGKVCAHLDVAFACDKLQLEIFRTPQPNFRYKRELLGSQTGAFLKILIKKYHLPNWVLTE